MYLSDELAERLDALPISERYDICARAARLTESKQVRSRLLTLALEPRIGDVLDYDHLMTCTDRHCPKCAG
jgi:hypothetical protein